MTLKRKTFSAIRWTTFAALVRSLLSIGQVAVLARLLSPEDYGLMAIVGIVLSFAGLFSDMGISSAYVQQQEVTLMQRASLFWLNVLISVCIAILMIAISPLIAWFFGDSRLTPLIIISTPILVFGALGQQVRMSAEKQLNFRPVIVLEICALFLGFGAGTLAALAGWGVYSLVVSGIVTAATGTLSAWFFIAGSWRPLWRLCLDDIRPFIGFGSASVANDIVNQLNSTVDLWLGGRFLAVTQLGLYSVPRNLSLQVQSMVNPIITRIGFPLIAQVQSDTPRVRAIYLKTMNMTASANAPLYVGIAFFAPEITTLLLGSAWERSANLLRILALWGGLRSTGNPVGSLLFGMGHANLALKWNLGLCFLVPPIVWLGSQGGPEGIAWGLLSIQVALFIPAWYFLIKPLARSGLTEYSVAALKPFFLAGVAIAPAFWAAKQFDGSLNRLLVGVAISTLLYLLISMFANRAWYFAMKELISNQMSNVEK